MEQIISAAATRYAPQLFTRPPEEDPKQLDAGMAAISRAGKALGETKPDALIIFASAIFAGKRWSPPVLAR